MQNTQLAARPQTTIRGLLEGDDFKMQVAKALPIHLKPDRFIRVALTAITRTPKLAQCDKASFFQALLNLSAMGIEPDGRRAHLIPFENRRRGVVECQLIVDYKGIAELAMRSGMVSYLHADIVCENDVFEFNMGEIGKHIIDFKSPRGDVYAAYAICKFKDGTAKADVMTRDEIEAIRKRSRAGQSGPWVTDWNEMAKKTVFRRLSKWLPLSPEIRDAVENDDEQFEFAGQSAARRVDPIAAEVMADLGAQNRAPSPAESPAAFEEAEEGGEEMSGDFDAVPPAQRERAASPQPPPEASTPNPAPAQAAGGTMGREQAIAALEDAMLEKGVSESAMLDYATKAGLVPQAGMQLMELPTASLAKLPFALGVVALRAKAGGEK